jgi:tellurite resistance protein TerC
MLMLALDLGVFHKKAHAITLKEAAIWSLVWVCLACLFGAGLYRFYGSDRALEFITGYLIEKSLSVDNIFVFVMLFAAFAVPAQYQHRVLFWGVFGALLLRALFIVAGTALLQRFHWVIYVFGLALVGTGIKVALEKEAEVHPEKSRAILLIKRFLPVVPRFSGASFTLVENGKRYATPLLLTLVAVEITDVIFALDSIPAIFGVTRDPFIVFTSNIFAILGLRSMYFLLAGVVHKFFYLKFGLAIVLVFVGLKMLLSKFYELPIWISLIVIAVAIGCSILASLVRSQRMLRREAKAPRQHRPGHVH